MPQPFLCSPPVQTALDAGRPVVALESTIITHGMPWPQNVEMARGVEGLIRAEGPEPATVAVLDGVLRIGLSDHELLALGQTQGAMKLSRADLPFAMATGRTGSTTVAATMIAAALAGIGTFATGGIGGVHRGAETSFDVSADLDELARTPVTVVCAGAKAILDLKKTFEVLETKGVPVIGYGVDELPSFWSRGSGIPSPLRLDTPEAIADFGRMRDALSLGGGVLVANPLPPELEIDRSTVAGWIEAALADAEGAGTRGKDVTPFLLRRIFELSGGRSLEANIALVRSNARLAARIAVAAAARRETTPPALPSPLPPTP
ncbi:pseudouridine-5'-phosphate glycosidase [Aureimonas flava]|uniref:Pseudouridine-5'-phosphate glycosidase n=1 Tax=Aureimonas flava TaxID=2320271 RepID=A0A3A1WSA6_9HYPH|nr:pseudouridine-5'-phosphate glycosidase [Aureimonas flava]RIY03605.1 pseudouridine-5'-phosphate glycosidase [Aureimonas flava]